MAQTSAGGLRQRHYKQRMCLPAHAARNICTEVILGLTTAESLQVRLDQLLVNLYINPKLIFMSLSPSIHPISLDREPFKVRREGSKVLQG